MLPHRGFYLLNLNIEKINFAAAAAQALIVNQDII
jgi:hypothetical protein